LVAKALRIDGFFGAIINPILRNATRKKSVYLVCLNDEASFTRALSVLIE